ncbi:AAA domain-containing protein [Mesomycoplasma neurolyticum]|uniref:Putative DNA helicase n=1 Tax=Mesomycoplasma neurolyticum TaxID=2120 RepID=A0A449A4K6_9BACT|nr:AAA domain-containing protein [Mesomycoplasma neurolyticum]VEU59103.1 putative DNA helicase [Mesomycoplasma neurolyticum]
MENNYRIFKEKKKNYKRILDNLLNVDKIDTSLKLTVDEKNFIDLHELLDEKSIENIYLRQNFKVSLSNNNAEKILKDLSNVTNLNELKYVYRKHKQIIDEKTLNAFEKNFDSTLKKAKLFLEETINKNNNRWKKFLAKAKNINMERNIWPMQIGVLFISAEIEKRTIYAPLFFKEVNIEIKNGQATLFSNGDIKINEKLSWFLERGGYLFDLDEDVSQMSLKELEQNLKNIWSSYDIKSFKGKIENLESVIVNENYLEFHKGMVLGIFTSFGSYQRKVMEKIIENDEFDTILDVEINKNKYKTRIDRTIYDDNFNFIKINKTNFSQDVATVSALSQNTIIWGPPGTGKSQTISNIIANVIFFQKKAIVVSQKKAALDILKSRMNSLSIFCLFILNDNSMQKSKFYEPIVDLINKLENFKKANLPKLVKILDNDEKKHVDLLNKIKNSDNYEKDLEIYSFLKKQKKELSLKTIENLYKLSKNINLNPSRITKDPKKLKILIFETLKNKKVSAIKKLFIKFNDDINRDANIILNDFADYDGDLSEITNKIVDIEKEKLINIDEFYKHLIGDDKQDICNEEEITNYVTYRLFKKINNFNKEKTRLYHRFALAARNGWRDPYKFVLDHYVIIKELFPIIISSVDTELTKWDKEEFDYAILDESSQIFIEKAIPILYLAKIKILAGDDKQMQPTSWFSTRSDIEDIELGNIESILNYAVYKGIYSILLDKNYRSNFASLMTFSSKHFYNSKLDVIDKLTTFDEEPIEVYDINGEWKNKSNLEEAKLVVELAQANLSKYNKIIILTFNRPQRELIENIIFNKYLELEKAINEEKILLKNIENIQGDEADLLIVSVVYDKTTALSSTYVSRRGGQNALNVAISRAKNKMIIVKSIKANEIETLNTNDDLLLFKKWLLFLELSNDERKRYLLLDNQQNNNNSSESEVNNLVDKIIEKILKMSIFIEQNYKIKKDYIIGSKKIDLAILNKENMFLLGIAIDDYNNYSNYEEYIIFKDSISYLLSKKYNLLIIEKIKWLINRDKILNLIEEKLTN